MYIKRHVGDVQKKKKNHVAPRTDATARRRHNIPRRTTKEAKTRNHSRARQHTLGARRRVTQGQWTAFKNRYSPKKKKNIYNKNKYIPDDILLRELNNKNTRAHILYTRHIHTHTHIYFTHTHSHATEERQDGIAAINNAWRLRRATRRTRGHPCRPLQHQQQSALDRHRCCRRRPCSPTLGAISRAASLCHKNDKIFYRVHIINL